MGVIPHMGKTKCNDTCSTMFVHACLIGSLSVCIVLHSPAHLLLQRKAPQQQQAAAASVATERQQAAAASSVAAATGRRHRRHRRLRLRLRLRPQLRNELPGGRCSALPRTTDRRAPQPLNFLADGGSVCSIGGPSLHYDRDQNRQPKLRIVTELCREATGGLLALAIDGLARRGRLPLMCCRSGSQCCQRYCSSRPGR